jgi:hypothetical protein
MTLKNAEALKTRNTQTHISRNLKENRPDGRKIFGLERRHALGQEDVR